MNCAIWVVRDCGPGAGSKSPADHREWVSGGDTGDSRCHALWATDLSSLHQMARDPGSVDDVAVEVRLDVRHVDGGKVFGQHLSIGIGELRPENRTVTEAAI
jgi:hypothetical protein